VCLLHCNSTAHKDLEKIRRSGDANLEVRLANLADEDTVEEENGLGRLWNSVQPWAKIEMLCEVHKYRIGRHRFYFWGNHKDCNYHVRFVIPFKRDETDQAKQSWFQEKVLKSITDDKIYRTLETNKPVIDEDDEN